MQLIELDRLSEQNAILVDAVAENTRANTLVVQMLVKVCERLTAIEARLDTLRIVT